jgi:sigma-B regulation protein RsbU (phosphoserine phosphatase)
LTGVTSLFTHLGPLALVYFGIIFPEPLLFDRKFPWITWIVIGPMLVRAGLVGLSFGLLANHRGRVLPIWANLTVVAPLATNIELVLIGLFFVILGYKMPTAAGDARRRFLLLDTGATVGLLPSLITLTRAVIQQTNFCGWPARVSIGALLLFPITMAYVIVVHRAMDVWVVLRPGLQYRLATSGIRILQVCDQRRNHRGCRDDQRAFERGRADSADHCRVCADAGAWRICRPPPSLARPTLLS